MFFGEIHSEIRVVEFLRHVLAANVVNLPRDAKLHIVMEHFSLDMNKLLDTHLNNPSGKFDYESFKNHYLECGAERHNLDPYREFFEDLFRLSYFYSSGLTFGSTSFYLRSPF